VIKIPTVKYKSTFFSSVLTLGLCITSIVSSLAQSSLQIQTGGSIESIVKSLEGPNVTISNVSFYINSESTPVGTFNDVLGLLDIKKGLIMTSGDAKLIVGPNNKPNASAGSKTSAAVDSDSDLESVVPGEDLYDLVTIEFDIEVRNSVLSFNYIFGSEEYPEYEREYNDVFGFFISGPGIDGVQNIAVTETGIPVSVKSINSSKNTGYYVSNGDGSNPAKDFYVQYDGFTKKLTARAEVIPCKTYHIKLAIADARDAILDSGVLIEEGSFTSTSKLDIELEYEHKEYPYAVETCNDGYFIIKKNLNWLDVGDEVTFEYTLTGTAIKDTDYHSTTLTDPAFITIPGNQESIKIDIIADTDALPEDTETVVLNIILRCDTDIIATASATMPIKDAIEFPINSKVCKDVLMPINTNANERYQFTWLDNAELVFIDACTKPNCPTPSVNLSTNMNFGVHVKDLISTCEADTEVKVTVDAVEAYFKYSKNNNYPSTDAYFDNLSTGAEVYLWDFGDGKTSSEFEPTHNYNLGASLEPQTFKITLNVSSMQGLCKDGYDTTIVILPFYIPNVITPNTDLLNDNFVVKGIEEGAWKIKIYNRWGTLVYSSDKYKNDWKGDGVSSGVYYFRLSNLPGDRQYKGWIHVIKND
jgi:gliding motility-associated-like protein